MKKMLFYIVFLFFFITLPIISEAASLNLETISNNISPSKNIVITVNAKDFNTKFGSIHFILKYDASKFNYVSSKALQGDLAEQKESGAINITIDSQNGMNNGKLYQITFTSNSTATSGSSLISIDTTNDCFDENLAMINVTGSTLTFNHYIASSIDTLSTLVVSGCDLSPKFNPETLNYSCNDTELDKITVTGSVSDSKAKVIGLGVNKLEYGNNNISIIVISENGNKKKYNINITRKDIRNIDNSLSSLEVVGYDINFDPNTFEYNLMVAQDVDRITINGKALENTSIVNGLGEVELKNENDSFFVTVQAENGSTKVYRINVIKKLKNDIVNNYLTSLSFNGIPINLTDSKIYLIGVSSIVKSLSLEYTTNNIGTECQVVGNDNLKEGINVVEIIIKAPSVEDTVYTLLVYKESIQLELKEFENIEIKDNYFFNNKESNNVKIPKSFLNSFIESDKYFKYNIINEYGGLLASFKFDQNSNINSDLELIFTKINSKNITYSSNVPSGVLISLYLENINKELKIYNYDGGEYKLIDTVKPENGYIEFISNGSENYIFSEEPLFNELKKNELTVINIFLIFGAGIIIGLILHYYFGNNKRKKINLEIFKL